MPQPLAPGRVHPLEQIFDLGHRLALQGREQRRLRGLVQGRPPGEPPEHSEVTHVDVRPIDPGRAQHLEHEADRLDVALHARVPVDFRPHPGSGSATPTPGSPVRGAPCPRSRAGPEPPPAQADERRFVPLGESCPPAPRASFPSPGSVTLNVLRSRSGPVPWSRESRYSRKGGMTNSYPQEEKRSMTARRSPSSPRASGGSTSSTPAGRSHGPAAVCIDQRPR